MGRLWPVPALLTACAAASNRWPARDAFSVADGARGKKTLVRPGGRDNVAAGRL